MNLDLLEVQRSGYTILDVLADVGGLDGILVQFSSLVIGILNFNTLESYLVSKLYKQQRD